MGMQLACSSQPSAHPSHASCFLPAVHDALDPEYSILKQRIARRLRHEGATDESVKSLNLSEWGWLLWVRLACMQHLQRAPHSALCCLHHLTT